MSTLATLARSLTENKHKYVRCAYVGECVWYGVGGGRGPAATVVYWPFLIRIHYFYGLFEHLRSDIIPTGYP